MKRAGGTRFRLFPEYASGYTDPEVVELSPPPGSVGIGPCDDRFYVANAILKQYPYEPPQYMPPYSQSQFAPATPNQNGHFDHVAAETPQFLSAHIYGAARHTLDIWERYFGRRIDWWHAPEIPRLELIPVVYWKNAQSGPGFLETGFLRDEHNRPRLLALNFDVIAHEIGHAIIFSCLGAPGTDRLHPEYLAFHESFADLIALIGCLDFASVRRRLFQQTEGNLYVLNLVSRIGEYSDNDQVRIASTTDTMSDVSDLHFRADGTWYDPTGQARNQHALGQPLTGAIFDILVEIYQDRLAALGLIRSSADVRGWSRQQVAHSMDRVHREHGRALVRFAAGFELALLEARDVVGLCMVHVIRTLDPETLTLQRAAAAFLEGASRLLTTNHVGDLLVHFLRHGIDPRVSLDSGRRKAGSALGNRMIGSAERQKNVTMRACVHARAHMRHEHRENLRAAPSPAIVPQLRGVAR